jgi:hypothetical protein
MTLSTTEDAEDTMVEFTAQTGLSLLSSVSSMVESCAVRS